MTDPSANTVWARAFADELARAGVREVVVAPGSRSTPLVMAFARDGRFTSRVHLDERSAAFFALGVGKATGRPAVMITTSGTAVANVFPAVVEASQSGVPLLVVTADRPHRLRGADANQAIDQLHVYGQYPRAFFEIAPPTLDARALLHLRGVACRAVAASLGAMAGPVHVNLPFDKPLEPMDPPGEFVSDNPLAVHGRPGGRPWVEMTSGRRTLSDEALRALVAGSDPSRGIIVAGPHEQGAELGPIVLRFSAATGFPVLADPLSGARYRPSDEATVVAGYDVFLRDADLRRRLEPTLVVRVGASPISASLQRWLFEHSSAEQVVIDDGMRFKDHGGTAARYVVADASDTLDRLATKWSVGRADATWTETWQSASEAAAAVARDRVALLGATLRDKTTPLHEGDAARAVHEALPPAATLFMSSSMPIRDLDAFGHPSPVPLRVLCNRGASGIDGVVSSAFGAASQADGPTVCLIGDVAFFHDQNGLLWSREADAAVVFVVIDNDGGGIFHMLPIAEHEPDFTRFFATPHGIDARHAAAAHAIPFRDVEIGDLTAEVGDAIETGGSHVLRVRTDRAAQQRLRSANFDEIIGSVRAALG